MLVFSQYKDTVKYLYEHLSAAVPQKKGSAPAVQLVHGDIDGEDVREVICRFSPESNDESFSQKQQCRILLATDKLSEGVNLQDAHIVVNYDLPWALIRLVQRAGRVDRIGQKEDTIYCYSALPEEGVERIINLRGRLRKRMTENELLIGTDERFFEDEKEKSDAALRRIFDLTVDLGGDDAEDETDLISYAYDIWRTATQEDEALAESIKNLPNVVYSAKAAGDSTPGVIAYIKDGRDNHILSQLDNNGDIVTQSQFKILKTLECEPSTPRAEKADNHHELVAKATKQVSEHEDELGGQLGGPSSVRRRIYNCLKTYSPPVLLTEEDAAEKFKYNLDLALEQLYQHPLRQNALNQLGRQVRYGASDEDLADMVVRLYKAKLLCELPKEKADTGESTAPKIICSLGLV